MTLPLAVPSGRRLSARLKNGQPRRGPPGYADLLADVFGPEAGYGCRATIGVQSPARNLCFEIRVEFGLRDGTD